MGVHGLTTYLRENQRLLSEQLLFGNGARPSSSVTHLVVDAYSFIFELIACFNLDWVYGGEYDEFTRLVVLVVQSWIAVGLKLYFVFDGPTPPLKFDTIVSRLTENSVKTSLLFFRTSPSSRSTPRSLNESRILPPLSGMVCFKALQSVARAQPRSLEIHFAQEEGDPYAVQLAGKVGGYVTGRDSDFVILNTDGYRGYIPLGEFVWRSSQDASESSSQADEQLESDFQPVQRRKKAGKQARTDLGMIPPPGSSEDSLLLVCTVYRPSALADHLDIPVSLLPLLGALVGNDFSKVLHLHSIFFARNTTLSQRITRVSTTLRTVLMGSAGPKRKQKPITSVMDLIRRTVFALFIRDASHMSSGEQEAIVEKIVESTLQYAIPKHEEHLSDLRGPACLLRGSAAEYLPISIPSLPDNSALIRELYNAAYQRGDLLPKPLDVLHSRSYWPKLFLENPDLESVTKTISRPIREWLYAILDDGVGVPEKVEPEPSEPSQQDENEEGDEDELVDVVEEHSSDEDDELFDPLAPLRGALQRLEMDTTTPPLPSTPVQRKPRFVDEYIRRGTRVAPEEVPVPALSTLLSYLPTSFATPVQLQPEATRFRLLISILSSDPAFDTISALPQEQVIPVLAIRSVLKILYERWMLAPNNKERLKEKWTKREVSALLSAFVNPPPDPSDGEASPPSPPEIVDRHVQLTAQVFAALESVTVLAQVLLLDSERLPMTLISSFSGRRFHALLNHGATKGSTQEFVASEIPSELWKSVTVGFDDDVFVEDRGKKSRKAVGDVNRRKQKQTGNVAKGRFNGGMFGLLADVEA